MKTRIFSFFIICLLYVSHLSAQDENIQERMIGYRTLHGLISAENTVNLFETDSGRFYYSANLVKFENPYTSYLKTPFDTLHWFLTLGFSFFDYQQTVHPEPFYAIGSFGVDVYGINAWYNTWGMAFDSVSLFYQNNDNSFIYAAGCNQSFDNGQRLYYQLVMNGYFWDDQYYIFNDDGLLKKSFTFDDNYVGGQSADTASTEEFTYQSGKPTAVFINVFGLYGDPYTKEYTYTYDATGRFIKRELNYTFGDSFEKTKQELVYTGNNLGSLNYYTELDGTWQLDQSVEFTYAEGKLTRVDFDDLDTGTNDPYYKYFYNANGQYDSISKYYRNNEGNIQLNTIEKFDYDVNQRLTFYKFDNYIYMGDGEIYVDYDYNNEGKIEEINNYSPGQDYYYPYNYTYTYNASGNIASKSYNTLPWMPLDASIYDGLDDLNTIRDNYNTIWFYYEKNASDPAGSETESIYVHAYPNPASGEINLLLGNTNSGGIITIEITNIAGQKMYQEKTSSEINFTRTIDCSKFAGGIYFVTISDGINTSWQKIIIQ